MLHLLPLQSDANTAVVSACGCVYVWVRCVFWVQCGVEVMCDVVWWCLCPGLNVEGLYRMGGQTEEVMRIKADFDRGKQSPLASGDT